LEGGYQPKGVVHDTVHVPAHSDLVHVPVKVGRAVLSPGAEHVRKTVHIIVLKKRTGIETVVRIQLSA
jgi:hypothetical protein